MHICMSNRICCCLFCKSILYQEKVKFKDHSSCIIQWEISTLTIADKKKTRIKHVFWHQVEFYGYFNSINEIKCYFDVM